MKQLIKHFPIFCYRKVGLRAYTGAGSNTVQTFPSDEESDDGNQVDFVSAWRPGQPPRSDCIIKLTKGKETKKVRIIAYYRFYPLLIFIDNSVNS